jgi:pilus assembly protein CpaF
MENLFLLSGFDLPYHVVRKQISSAVDFIVQISRDKEGNRVISEILELTGMESDTILSSSIARYEDGSLKATGFVPQKMDEIERNSDLDRGFFN